MALRTTTPFNHQDTGSPPPSQEKVPPAAGESPDFVGADDFDPRDPPHFRYAELRAAIPKHCFRRDARRSLGYAARDVAAIAILGAAAAFLDSGYFWPIYWLAQGLMFFAIFFIGHDCGHGSFSESSRLNDFVGCCLNTFILVPYHSWRISHRHHHQHQGHADDDESWVPVTESVYRTLPLPVRFLRFTMPFQLFIWPFYMLCGKLGTRGRSYFNPYSEVVGAGERTAVMASLGWWAGMAGLLVGASRAYGVGIVFKLYAAPYLIFVMWLDLITYLHHHSYDHLVPWYRGKEWSYIRGGLCTVDHDYGWVSRCIHYAGTHVVHHFFPQIPHYNLVEATEAIKPVLGKWYREPNKSAALPFHLVKQLAASVHRDHFVSDGGDVVFYRTDPSLHRLPKFFLKFRSESSG